MLHFQRVDLTVKSKHKSQAKYWFSRSDYSVSSMYYALATYTTISTRRNWDAIAQLRVDSVSKFGLSFMEANRVIGCFGVTFVNSIKRTINMKIVNSHKHQINGTHHVAHLTYDTWNCSEMTHVQPTIERVT